ncbi:MAG: hypothetical protein OEV40_20505 [Acidimicrobiia bacterium]|nr:hypothetical protein [Acidimicrobiia bacterium]
MESSTMRVKTFAVGVSSWRNNATAQIRDLENQINRWLEANPNLVVGHANRLSQPIIGWGELAVAVWYSEPDIETRVPRQ